MCYLSCYFLLSRYYWLSKKNILLINIVVQLLCIFSFCCGCDFVLFMCIFKSDVSPLPRPLTPVSCAFRRRRRAPSAWATWLGSSTFWSEDSVWPCWWPWLSSVTSPEPRRNEWRWQRMHRILTQLPRRIHRILQLIRKVTTYMGSKV